MPLYVLTSGSTGSAAENLSYTLKNHGRATLVGETTAGGGHSARPFPLGEGFIVHVPMARIIHPETGAGFDGVGVKPDVAVRAEEALDKARQLALETLLARTSSVEEEGPLQAALENLELKRRERQAGATVAAPDMEAYVGTYGIRSVFLDRGTLKYRRHGGPALELRRISRDLFKMQLPEGAWSPTVLPSVRFERDDQDQLKGFSLVHKDGSVEVYADRLPDSAMME